LDLYIIPLEVCFQKISGYPLISSLIVDEMAEYSDPEFSPPYTSLAIRWDLCWDIELTSCPSFLRQMSRDKPFYPS
jgi:hypothetical protein